MTAETLSQYKSAKAEIVNLKRELETMPDYIQATDTVKSSSAEHPYTEHPLTIHGVIPNPKKQKLKKRLERLEVLVADVDEFLETIENANTLRVIKLHYIEGLQWEDVALEMGICKSGDSFRKKAERYLKKYSKAS